VGTVCSDHDRGALGHSEGQDAENALCVPYRPILDNLDPRVFVTARVLDEQGRGASMETDRVGDGERDLWNGNPPSRARSRRRGQLRHRLGLAFELGANEGGQVD
jgi:hypothetical protein